MKLSSFEAAMFRVYIHEKLLPDARRNLQRLVDNLERVAAAKIKRDDRGKSP